MKRICLPRPVRKALASSSGGQEETVVVEVRGVTLNFSDAIHSNALFQLEGSERPGGNTLPIFTSRCKRQTATHKTHSRTFLVPFMSTSRISLLLVQKTKEVSQCNAHHYGVATKLLTMCGKLPIRLVGARSVRQLLKGESAVFALRI